MGWLLALKNDSLPLVMTDAQRSARDRVKSPQSAVTVIALAKLRCYHGAAEPHPAFSHLLQLEKGNGCHCITDSPVQRDAPKLYFCTGYACGGRKIVLIQLLLFGFCNLY